MTSWFAKVQQHIGGCRFSARPVDRPFADDCKPLLSDRLFMIFRRGTARGSFAPRPFGVGDEHLGRLVCRSKARDGGIARQPGLGSKPDRRVHRAVPMVAAPLDNLEEKASLLGPRIDLEELGAAIAIVENISCAQPVPAVTAELRSYASAFRR
jgi:hypothetical protein